MREISFIFANNSIGKPHRRPIDKMFYISSFKLQGFLLSQSKASFVAKLSIVLEETDESAFWLEFIIDEQSLKRNLVEPLLQEANELTAIFFSSRKTAKKKN